MWLVWPRYEIKRWEYDAGGYYAFCPVRPKGCQYWQIAGSRRALTGDIWRHFRGRGCPPR